MESLTMWYDGNHAICTNEDCTSDSCPFADAPCEHVQEVIDRLAAYEDLFERLGLDITDPVQVEELSALAKSRAEAEAAIGGGRDD